MSRALVTGGAGFIGSHMTERLLALGWDVTVLDNESTGDRANVPADARYIKGDVRSAADVGRAFEPRPELVVHIAGQASTVRSFMDPADDLSVNVGGTLQVLEAAIKHATPRLLFASSMTVYGHPDRLPVAEDQALQPVSYYGVTKLAAERYMLATGQRTDLAAPPRITAFRMFNVYGPRQSLHNPYQGVLAIFIGAALRNEKIVIHSDGEQTRDFVFIDDVVDAWIAAIDKPAAFGRAINLGSGARLSINAIVDATLAAVDKTRAQCAVAYEPVRPGDQRHMEADVRLAASLLDWRPRVSFEQGLARTMAWAERAARGEH